MNAYNLNRQSEMDALVYRFIISVLILVALEFRLWYILCKLFIASLESSY